MKNNHLGFTLMELVISMAILAILSTAGVSNYVSSLKKGRDAQRKSDLGQLQRALELYSNDHQGQYPNGSSGQIAGCPADSDTACAWGTGEFKASADGAVYMKKMVADPQSAKNYYYVSDNRTYQLYALLENTNDLCFDNNPENCKTDGFTGINCAANVLCNYGVASSNASP